MARKPLRGGTCPFATSLAVLRGTGHNAAMRIDLDHGVAVNLSERGPKGAPAVVLAHPLALNLHVWDDVLPLLPKGLRLVAMDMRGHGASDIPAPPYAMGALVKDAEALCDALGIRDCVFVGNSIGGMIAQGLATKRLDLVRGLVLAGTAPKIGTPQLWADRIKLVESSGMQGLVDDVLARWFTKPFRASAAVDKWRAAILNCDANGYMGCAAAISGTDFYTQTAALRLPVLVTAGDADGSTPPDMVRELADLIPGSDFHLMRGSGHVPAADQPAQFAELLTGFLQRIGHV